MLLAGRMAWVSIAENEHYELLSESNRVNLTLVPPRRGWIVDRYGKPLANNKTDFRVDIIPDRLHHKEATFASRANFVSLDPDDVDPIKADQIGRAWCRGRVRDHVKLQEVPDTIKAKKANDTIN